MTVHPQDSWMPQQSQDSPQEVLIGLAMEEIELAGMVIAIELVSQCCKVSYIELLTGSVD
jgi:hypothetical protein